MPPGPPLAADPDGDGSGPGLAEDVDATVGDEGEAGEAFVAVDLIDLGQQGGVVGCVAARAGVGGGLPAVVADLAGPAVLRDEVADLGPGEARRQLEEPLHQAIAGLPEVVVVVADQRTSDEGLGGAPVDNLSAASLPASKARTSSRVRIRSVRSVTGHLQ